VIEIKPHLTPTDLLPKLERMWRRSAECIEALHARLPTGSPSPVVTVNGQYTAREWTEWTKGFQFGSALLQFDATRDQRFLDIGRGATVKHMPNHLTHVGVHDHGFNIVSTYGTLWRLMNERRIPANEWERRCYEHALRVSGAVQAARWGTTRDGTGYIYSFNGPHSLFVDTIRSCRPLALAHQLGQVLAAERDERISLFRRLVEHALNTARYNIYYGEGRDVYDVPGRTAHEALFNPQTGDFRCPSTQQGFSPFGTWTRGLAWAMLGFTELLEWLSTRPDEEFAPFVSRGDVEAALLNAGRATCDYYIHETPTCGVPYWDSGAPGLSILGDYRDRPADPFNDREPVDSSAAVVAAQGLLRLGHYLVHAKGETEAGVRYVKAGLAVVDTLFDEPYLSSDPAHEGLILHSVYHRPNGWDHIPPGRNVPCGEASMWGDYHARELALYVQRLAENTSYYTFYGPQWTEPS
jgi:hypothetical protein